MSFTLGTSRICVPPPLLMIVTTTNPSPTWIGNCLLRVWQGICPLVALMPSRTRFRRLFMAHARAANRALVAFRQELRVGQNRQDDLTSELRVHWFQTFKAVRTDTDALKMDMTSVQRDVAAIFALAKKTEELTRQNASTVSTILSDMVPALRRDIAPVGGELRDLRRQLAAPESPPGLKDPPPLKQAAGDTPVDGGVRLSRTDAPPPVGNLKADTAPPNVGNLKDNTAPPHPLFPDVNPSKLTHVGDDRSVE